MADLIIVTQRNVVRQFPLTGPVTTIGRADVNHVTLDFHRVSRHHAAIEFVDGSYVITDLGSRNGTFVNHRKVRSWPLRHGDTVSVGDCVLRFRAARRKEVDVEALRLLTISGDPLPMGLARRAGPSASHAG